MPELRMNLITRSWVIIANERGKKPEDFIVKRVKKMRPEFLDTCPFCPGNESKTPDEIFRIHDERGWRLRIVRNRFSRLSEEGERTRWNMGLKRGVNGVGIHEIIIETPIHNLTPATIPVEQLKDLFQIYKERFSQLYKDPRVEHVIIFKNYGTMAGTSTEHLLSQVVGIPIIPVQARDRFEGSMRFFDETGDCLMCKIIQDELTDRVRVLTNTEHFVSFIPYAALSPFHIWISPKRHSGSFADIRPEEISDLAINLKSTISLLFRALESPDFNYVIMSGRPSNVASEFIHWYLSIVPRVDTPTGFELGSGMTVNPLSPEVSAEFLRRGCHKISN